MIVPTLRGVPPLRTLRVQRSTQSVRGCITTQSVGTITRIASKLTPTGFASTPGSQATAEPVGAYEQREAAIGCAAVVKMLDSPLLPALRTGSRTSSLLQSLRQRSIDDCSHARRGNTASDAPRPAVDAERQGMHYHAERGNDHGDREQVRSYRVCVNAALMIVPTLRVVTALQTLRVQPSTRSVRGCITTHSVGTITGIANKFAPTEFASTQH